MRVHNIQYNEVNDIYTIKRMSCENAKSLKSGFIFSHNYNNKLQKTGSYQNSQQWQMA